MCLLVGQPYGPCRRLGRDVSFDLENQLSSLVSRGKSTEYGPVSRARLLDEHLSNCGGTRETTHDNRSGVARRTVDIDDVRLLRRYGLCQAGRRAGPLGEGGCGGAAAGPAILSPRAPTLPSPGTSIILSERKSKAIVAALESGGAGAAIATCTAILPAEFKDQCFGPARPGRGSDPLGTWRHPALGRHRRNRWSTRSLGVLFP